LTEKNHKNEKINENPKIIWAKAKKIVERKPPNEKIISYSLKSDPEE